eukprot:1161430-Pelagomonas_calceolata.AAC.6
MGAYKLKAEQSRQGKRLNLVGILGTVFQTPNAPILPMGIISESYTPAKHFLTEEQICVLAFQSRRIDSFVKKDRRTLMTI